jgi:hypothetical protein
MKRCMYHGTEFDKQKNSIFRPRIDADKHEELTLSPTNHDPC